MTIGQKIKQLRKHLNMTQAEFGEKIGLKAGAIGLFENGERNVSERNISLICEKFNMNREWLEFGKGEMFQGTNSTILSQLALEYKLDDLEIDILNSYLTLEYSDRQAIKKMFQHFVRPRINNIDASDEHASAEILKGPQMAS